MFTFKIKRDDEDESTELTADTRDILLWERATKGASLSRLQTQMLMGDMYSLCWWACKRQKLQPGQLQLEAFEMEYALEFETEDVPDADKAAETDPTQ